LIWGPPSLISNVHRGHLSSRVEWTGRETDYSRPSSAEDDAWSYTSAHPIRLCGVDQDFIPGRGREEKFYHCHRVQTGSGAHPVLYPVGTGVLPRQKANGE
jgi:hypothetical protein